MLAHLAQKLRALYFSSTTRLAPAKLSTGMRAASWKFEVEGGYGGKHVVLRLSALPIAVVGRPEHVRIGDLHTR